MNASRKNPIYTTYIVSGDTKYNITAAVKSLEFTDSKKQISQCLTIQMANVKVGATRISQQLKVRDRVFVYANDGEQDGEVYRGFIWTRTGKDQLSDIDLTLKCYDNLIYFQESEDAEYFSSGKTTESIVSALCEKWGVKLEYSYSSITHTKMALRGTLSDIFTSDILDLVKKRDGEKYVIRSEKDVMKVMKVGSNSTVYTIQVKGNAEGIADECTMDGMVTKVIILGKADGNDRQPVVATISGKTSEYGTLQKIINQSSYNSLEEAKKEAQSLIDEDGEPKWEYATKGPDIPWIRKGDRVTVKGNDWEKDFIVIDIDRDITNKQKTMTLTLEDK